jgi:glucose-1-phosphate thymidylyltransferase
MKTIGIIPAAGYGKRLLPCRYPKELMPITISDEASSVNGLPRIKLVSEYALESLVQASVNEALVIVGDHKLEILKCLSDGRDFSIHLAYLHQPTINGLPYAIDCAFHWVKDCISVLVLPDTIISPKDCVKKLLHSLTSTTADLVLGIFPTEYPETLCPVKFDSEHKVVKLYDKPKHSDLRNTWGLAAWNPSFSWFLHNYLTENNGKVDHEIPLAEIISSFIANGRKVIAVPIEDGRFWDIGTPKFWHEAREPSKSNKKF